MGWWENEFHNETEITNLEEKEPNLEEKEPNLEEKQVKKESIKEVENTKKSIKTTHSDSFLNNISKPRQQTAEPPKTEKTKENPTKKDTLNSTEQEPTETTHKKISSLAINRTANFLVHTGDLILPQLMAHLDPDEEVEAEEYELDEKNTEYLVESWERFLEEKQVSMTSGQQLASAYAFGYGGNLLLMGSTRLLKYLDDRKKTKKETESLTENIRLQKELNELKEKELNNNKTVVKTPPPQKQEEPTQEVKTDNSVDSYFNNNNDEIGVEESTQKEVKELINNKESFKLDKSKEITTEKDYKNCANEKCTEKFIPFTGFAKKKDSQFYDNCCSRKCMNIVIGKKGGNTLKK